MVGCKHALGFRILWEQGGEELALGSLKCLRDEISIEMTFVTTHYCSKLQRSLKEQLAQDTVVQATEVS